jgi:hypothetical protein
MAIPSFLCLSFFIYSRSARAYSMTSALKGKRLGRVCYFFPPRLPPPARSFLAVRRVFFLNSLTLRSILYFCFNVLRFEGLALDLLENFPIFNNL